MSTKQQNLERYGSCWNKAEDDEPVFIIRAKDPIGAMIVRLWASLAESTGAHDRAKAGQAWNVSLDMDRWRDAKYGDAGKIGAIK